MFNRTAIDTTILRAKGQIYQEQKLTVSNLYTFNLVNKTMFKANVNFKILSHKGKIEYIGPKEIVVNQQDIYKGTMFIYLFADQLSSVKQELTIGVYKGNELIEEVETNFLGPNKNY